MRRVIVVLGIVAVVFSLQLAYGRRGDGLVTYKAKRGLPTIDGKLDDIWQLARPLVIETEVPGNSYFDETYIGQKYGVQLRSIYTDEDIYFFVQWNGDNEASYSRESWYYNDKEGKWMQLPKYKSDSYSKPVYEDKFAFIWEIGDSVPKFSQQGGSIFCKGEKKYTDSKDEKMDIWHWKLDRTGPVDQLDDKWLTFNGQGNNGRMNDEGTGAYKSNIQELKKGSKTYEVPKKWIPGKTDYHWIMADDQDAKMIIDIDQNNNLIDEVGNVLKKEEFNIGSSKLIPSLIDVKPATGSRGDVTVVEFYDEATKTWNLEIKRARVTGNDDDVQFSDSRASYQFSIAVFNAAAVAHATPMGLTGKSYALTFK